MCAGKEKGREEEGEEVRVVMAVNNLREMSGWKRVNGAFRCLSGSGPFLLPRYLDLSCT